MVKMCKWQLFHMHVNKGEIYYHLVVAVQQNVNRGAISIAGLVLNLVQIYCCFTATECNVNEGERTTKTHTVTYSFYFPASLFDH